MPPYFSVILPTYNRARMARTAIKTVLGQTMGDWECLEVDDGSTDETAAALAEFSGEKRIRVLRSEKNEGMNASRNKALELAKGEFVTFLDSDDLWLPERLEVFDRRVSERPKAGFIFSNAYVWRFGRLMGTLFHPARLIPEGRVPGHYAVGDRYLPYVTTNVAIRREAFNRWGLFRTEMKTLDTELYARFLAGGMEVAAIAAPLAVRRLHDEQLTGNYRENFEEALLALKGSGATADVLDARLPELCAETAAYLVKAGRPKEARGFLQERLGDKAKDLPVYRWTALPPAVLSLARGARRLFLMARHHPAFASRDKREVYRFMRPLLAEEEGA
jgi:glycosyltransferase involved in cell wall biosynthesis